MDALEFNIGVGVRVRACERGGAALDSDSPVKYEYDYFQRRPYGGRTIMVAGPNTQPQSNIGARYCCSYKLQAALPNDKSIDHDEEREREREMTNSRLASRLHYCNMLHCCQL